MDSYTKEVIDLTINKFNLKKLKETKTHFYWVREKKSGDYDYIASLIMDKEHEKIKGMADYVPPDKNPDEYKPDKRFRQLKSNDASYQPGWRTMREQNRAEYILKYSKVYGLSLIHIARYR